MQPVTLKLPATPELGELLNYQLVGFTLVVLSLAAIAFAISVLGFFFKRLDPGGKGRAAGALLQGAPAADTAGDPYLFVVIAAAVNAVISTPHRIHSVQGVPATKWHDWSMEGRRQIFSSHQVR